MPSATPIRACRALSVVLCLLCVMCSGHARAESQQGRDYGKVVLGAGARVSLERRELGTDHNPWALGFAVKGGLTLDMALYLGAAFEYYRRDYEDVAGRDEFKATEVIWQIMADVGRDIWLGDELLLRPKGALGYLVLHDEQCVDGRCGIGGGRSWLIGAGAELLWVMSWLWLGLEARYDIAVSFDTQHDGPIFGLNAGARF